MVFPNPQAAFHGIDSLTVEPGFVLEAGSGLASYLWNTGDTTESITIYFEGWYTVEMLTAAGCYGIDSILLLMPEEERPDVILWVPNAFTPDGDGLNDTFRPIPSNYELITSYKLMIFNRWGEFLWETYDIGEGWPGIREDELCPGDAYVYKIIWSAASVPGKDTPQVLAGMVIMVQ